MRETDECAAAKELGEKLGFHLIDNHDWIFDGNGERVSARNAYWLAFSGHDDERCVQPIRHGEWPRAAEIVIHRLWHCCVALCMEKAGKAKLDSKKQLNLALVVSGVVTAFLVVPLLLFGALHVISSDQFSLLWHYGSYPAVAAVGALIASFWTRF